MQEEVLDQIKNANSMEEFEQNVYSLIKSGINYREILKNKFQVAGTEIKLNVPKIKKIMDKFEDNTSTLHKDPDKALLFKCFQENMMPVDVVIKYGFDPVYVNKVYQEYTEMEGMETITFEQYDRLFCAAYRIKESHDFNVNCESLEQAVESYFELKKHVFYCRNCAEEIPITGKVLDDAQNYLSEKWGHTDCHILN